MFPWFALVYPELDSQIMQGLVNTYKESGWLPEWASPGHRDVMIGSNSANLIADAYLNGVRGFDVETLYEAMVKNATTSQGRPTDKRGRTLTAVGREGVELYNQLGYVPYDVGINESAARTLEYATADFSLSRLAAALGKTEDAKKYAAQAQNYRKLYDTEIGLDARAQQGRQLDEAVQSLCMGRRLHRGQFDALQLVGDAGRPGPDRSDGRRPEVRRAARFDLHAAAAVRRTAITARSIHETREMQVVNMGQYAHGNQPIQHMIYLYDWAGQPWKTQKHARDVMTKLYSATPDGYPGDEDNGQTSAWYVFSALGFYPVTPTVGEYAIGSPLFQKVSVTMPHGQDADDRGGEQQRRRTSTSSRSASTARSTTRPG